MMHPGMMHPMQWQQRQTQMMQGQMPQVQHSMNSWSQMGPQMGPTTMRTSPFVMPGMPSQPQLGGWPSAIPHQASGPVWGSPDQRFAIQSFNGGAPQLFSSHRPGGPMHHVTSNHGVPPQVRFQQMNYGRQFQFPQPGSPYLAPARPYAHALNPGMYPGLPSAWGNMPQVNINRPGMYQGGYPQMGRVPGAPYGAPPNMGPTPSNTNVSVEWDAQEQQLNGQYIMNVLQQLSVAGQRIEVQGVSGTFHLRHNIPPSRLAEHGAELQNMAQRLTMAIQSMGPMRVMSDGMRIWAEGASGQAVVVTRTQTLVGRGPVRVGSGSWQGSDGSQVTWGTTARGDEFRIQGPGGSARVVELQDGRTVREIFNGSSTPVATVFYDGRTDRPALVRINGQQASVSAGADGTGAPIQLPHGMHVVGEGGPVSLNQRPQSPDHARQMLQQMGRQLGSPEAIGAFVSSYFTVEDSITRTGNRIRTASTVNFEAEAAGQQYIQSAEESLMRATGDCEDFAVLASSLLDAAGISNIVARATPGHYVCAYLERSSNGGYILCKIDTGGFQRVPRVYRNPAEAMQSIWSGGGRSGVDWELTSTQGMPPEAQGRAREVAARGGGISAIVTNTIQGGNAQHAFIGFGDFDWNQIVHNRGGGMSAPRPPSYGGMPGMPGMPQGRPGYPGMPQGPSGYPAMGPGMAPYGTRPGAPRVIPGTLPYGGMRPSGPPSYGNFPGAPGQYPPGMLPGTSPYGGYPGTPSGSPEGIPPPGPGGYPPYFQ